MVLQSDTGVEVGDGEMVPKEMRVTSSNNGVGEKESGGSVIGVKSVALPRIVAEHDIGLQLPDDPGDPAPGREIALQLAVDVPEEPALAGVGPGEPPGGFALLVLAAPCQRAQVGVVADANVQVPHERNQVVAEADVDPAEVRCGDDHAVWSRWTMHSPAGSKGGCGLYKVANGKLTYYRDYMDPPLGE